MFFLSGPRPRPAILCRAGYGRGRVLDIYNIEDWRKSQCLVPPCFTNHESACRWMRELCSSVFEAPAAKRCRCETRAEAEERIALQLALSESQFSDSCKHMGSFEVQVLTLSGEVMALLDVSHSEKVGSLKQRISKTKSIGVHHLHLLVGERILDNNMLLAHVIEFQLAISQPDSTSGCTTARIEGPELTLIVEGADVDIDEPDINMQWAQVGA